jgi:hypothetical protein
MRFVRFTVVASLLFMPSLGCTWMKDSFGLRSAGDIKHGSGPLPSVQPEQLVGYLNERASKLESITYPDLHLRAFEKGMPTPEIIGTMACSQPRNFRLKGKGRLAGDIDLGSNSDQFWAYVHATGEPMFIYCSYSDFDSGKAQMPAGMPFEPDWVMQVIGMTTLPPGGEYVVTTNDKDRTYTLSWPSRTPQGQAVRKEIVFEGDPAGGNRPQVKKHLMKDAKTGKVICFADVKRAQTQPIANGVIQYPTQVTLRWEEQKFEMDLSLGEGKVNEQLGPDVTARRFQMPRNLGANPINLAEYRIGPR